MWVSIIGGLELNVGVKGVKVTAYQNTAGETVEYEGEGWTSTIIEGGKVVVKMNNRLNESQGDDTLLYDFFVFTTYMNFDTKWSESMMREDRAFCPETSMTGEHTVMKYTCCLLLIDKSRGKDKTYILSVGVMKD
jgi:hypothetical protein